MTRLTVHEYAAARAGRKAVKNKILDEFCQTTGMHRKAAIRLLAEARPRFAMGAPAATPLHAARLGCSDP